MIRPPSNQKPYDEYWSGDPAIVQVDQNDPVAFKEHVAKIRRARETMNWTGLVMEGARPTKFVMRPIRGSQFRWLHDQVHSERIKDAEAASLAFRCAFVDAVDAGMDIEKKFVDHPSLGRIASEDVVDLFDSIHLTIVSELGTVAYVRAQTLNPL